MGENTTTTSTPRKCHYLSEREHRLWWPIRRPPALNHRDCVTIIADVMKNRAGVGCMRGHTGRHPSGRFSRPLLHQHRSWRACSRFWNLHDSYASLRGSCTKLLFNIVCLLYRMWGPAGMRPRSTTSVSPLYAVTSQAYCRIHTYLWLIVNVGFSVRARAAFPAPRLPPSVRDARWWLRS